MELNHVHQTLLLDQLALALETFLLLSIHSLESVVRHKNNIKLHQLIVSHSLNKGIGAVPDKGLQSAVGIILDLLLPLHNSYRWNQDK